MKCVPLLSLALVAVFFAKSECTMCKPFSKFKIDCNVCRCSENGRQYSCTKTMCYDKNPFLIDDEGEEDGYVLKRNSDPKIEREFEDDDDEDFANEIFPKNWHSDEEDEDDESESQETFVFKKPLFGRA